MITRSLCSLALVSLASLAACTPEAPGSAPSATPTIAIATSAAPVAAGVVDLVSGTSIGPVRLGMNRGELEALQLPVKPGAMPGELLVGPYSVMMRDSDRAATVRVALSDLPAGARVGGAVFVAASAKIEGIAPALPGCGPVQMNRGASLITCDGGKTRLIAGGPHAAVYLEVENPAGAPSSPASESKWAHPGMAMSFSYPDKLLKVSHKPDGATLQSEILGKIEDRSGAGKDKPQPLTISVSVRIGKLAQVLKSEHIEEKDCAAATLAGGKACRFQRGSHDAQQELFFRELPGDRTLEVVCDYLGDMGKPKVSMAEQAAACARVVSTLSYQPR